MQIDVVQSVAPISTRTADAQLAAIARQPPVASEPIAVSSTTPSVSVSTSVASASSSPETNSSGGTASSTASTSSGTTASQGVSSSALLEASLVAFYSTVFGGKKYPAAVELTQNGQYTAFVATLPGATASGSTVQSAEAALGPVIDVMA